MTTTHSAQASLGGHPLLHGLARNWWVFLLRGLAAIAFGVLAFVWPAITLATLVLLFGIYAFADGILAIVGLAGIAAGVMTFVRPDIAAAALLIVIAAWALAAGLMEIIGAIQLRKEIDNEWLLILSGIFSMIFGAILLFRPGLGTLALIYTIGSFAIAYGVLLIAFSVRLRPHAREST